MRSKAASKVRNRNVAIFAASRRIYRGKQQMEQADPERTGDKHEGPVDRQKVSLGDKSSIALRRTLANIEGI